MFKLHIFVCVITQCLFSSSIFCIHSSDTQTKEDLSNEKVSYTTNYDQSDEDLVEHDAEHIEDFIDPHSLFYDRQSKKVIQDTDKRGMSSENNEDCEAVRLYYKRLIMMLLSNSNLKMDSSLAEGQINIQGTVSQIEVLKKVETDNYSLKEIDVVLSEILLKPSFQHNYNFYMPDLYEITQLVLQFVDNYDKVIITTCCVLATIILSRVIPLRRAFFIIIVTSFAVSFCMTWRHMITEAEIKLAVTQVKYIEMPVACQPHKMSLWDKVKSYWYDKECEKYHEAKMINPALQVTPVLVLSHLFATMITHPVGHAGEAISKFIDNATGHLNFLQKFPVQVMMYLCLPLFFVLLVFFVRGGSFDLGLGPLFRFSFSTQKQPALPHDDSHKRQTIELIREVIAELPLNIPPSIAAGNDPAPLSITHEKQESDNPASNGSSKDRSDKSIRKESRKESNLACGDSAENNPYSQTSSEINDDHIEDIEMNSEKFIGGGDT